MLNQENIYQYIAKENWEAIIMSLHQHRKEILSDPLLNNAACIFSIELLKRAESIPLDRAEITAQLENLFILHSGKFYVLTDENFKKLIRELVKRKPIEEAYGYAKFNPSDDLCKEVIEKYKAQQVDNISEPMSIKQVKDWIEIYNRIFELIGDSKGTTYISGPQFIAIVKLSNPYFPDYTQYIKLRNRERKSISRRIFFYDILAELKDDVRLQIVKNILNRIKPFKHREVNEIEVLLGLKVQNTPVPATSVERKKDPKVFISYSWDSEAHKNWVLSLADRLLAVGIDVLLDQYDLGLGKNLQYFVENSIASADRVLIIFTPNYKLKADKRAGGVGYEYSIMNADLYSDQVDNGKFIPILKSGTSEESIPKFMQQYIHLDVRDDSNFEDIFHNLIREIYDEPVLKKPVLGEKPDLAAR